MRSVCGEAEQVGGALRQVPLRLAAERAAVDDRGEDRGRAVVDGDDGAARERAVGDADERLGQLDPAGGLVAVEAGAVPGGDRGAEDRERELGRRRRGAGAAADQRAGAELADLARLPAREERAVGLDRGLGLLGPRLGGGVEGTGRRPGGRRASRRRCRGSAPSCRAGRRRRRRAGTARARRGGGRRGAAGRLLRERARRDDRECGDQHGDASRQSPHGLSPLPTR